MKTALKVLCILALCVTLSSCTNSGATLSALDNMGFTNVELTGFKLFSCSEDDVARTGFKALNPNGKVVTGVVCWAPLKGSTVRFD